ncbi:hypothetical protein L1987_19911 [Smallanthus sonchifolius]|uniref:Uncharacterized protein n=1 Tax=Smallanthus sonchifolius TaxID=185202 RepID=A0ACB9IQK6_9ASTR|nr:hypothetical protein L1987_19911 [Smallanthus sonchifolius]
MTLMYSLYNYQEIKNLWLVEEEQDDEAVTLAGAYTVKPEVRDAIAREVVLTLKNILPDLLSEALKKSKEEDEGINEEKIYDSDGDEVEMGSSNRGCTYKGFKDGDPPKFDGSKDSVATFEWIERMNAVGGETSKEQSRQMLLPE